MRALKCILADGYFLSCQKEMKKIQSNVWGKAAMNTCHSEPCYKPRPLVSSALQQFLAVWAAKCVQETRLGRGFTPELRLPLMNMYDEAAT